MTPGIIDYGAGNLSSVCNSFRAIGMEGKLIRTEAELAGVTHLVLPGVGAFGDCARALRDQGLAEPIRRWIDEDKPFLGICIGYQILFESSEESPGADGLGILKGHVRRFPEGELKVPHMGWNSVHPTRQADPIWQGMGRAPYFYYVHSYFPEPEDSSIIAATSTYGCSFAAAIRRGRMIATQFHPEKSQMLGLKLLQNYINLS
ncbi:MAG: imidazole glycerol phosphate synthase subunit HisH [Akkermansia sp.]|nr:imidazole glycerol phosphate synthase subunit HisH [Akkermansia sp.]